jgi:beta-glucosidase
MSEGRDAATLSLPEKQDDLVAAVAAANPHTIVVLETGGPVTMPWIDKVSGVVAAFFPGIRGAEAIANILFGEVNPSAKLPVTFAKSEADLPHPQIAGMNLTPPAAPPAAPPATPPTATAGAPPAAPTGGPGGFGGGMRGGLPPFDVPYTEGLKVGYKWYDAENKEPLFPFGYGLSFTTYAYSGLKVTPAENGMTVSFSVKNTGKRGGQEIAEVYASLPSSTGEPPKRLIGWDRVELAPGQSKTVTVNVEPLFLSVFNEQKDGWQVVAGDYKVLVGGSSHTLPLTDTVKLAGN